MRTLTLSLVLVLAACSAGMGGPGGSVGGRGLPSRLPQSLQAVYIETNTPESELREALRTELMAAGAYVAEHRHETETILRISREDIERRVGTGSRNGPRDAQLIYNATYVVTVEGRELFFPETVNAYRNYTVGGSSSGDFAQAHEEYALRQAMARDLARLVMRKLTMLRDQ